MKSNSIFAALAKTARAIFGASSFCNIAEGTHAGSMTFTAGENIDDANLIVKAGALAGQVETADAADKPVGVSADEAAEGEAVSVLLAGCAESTFMCRAASDISAGQTVYTAAAGKVSAIAADGAYKIGVALTEATSGCAVEIDPRGFGERAWQVYACGSHTWTGSTNSENVPVAGTLSGDIVFASIQSAGGSEKSARASASTDAVVLSLDAAGTAGSTKIAWIIIRKN